MKIEPQTIGAALRALRLQRQLTQLSAATAAAMSRSRLAAIESGQSANLELTTLQKLLDVYGAELHVEPRSPRRSLNQILRDQEKG